MKHNAVLIGVAVIALAVFAVAVSAGDATALTGNTKDIDQTTVKVKADADIVKEDWLTYVGSYVGFTQAYSEYQFCNPSNKSLSVDMAAKSKDTMSYYLTDLKNSVKDSWLEIRTNETFKYKQWVPDVKCVDDETKNGTKFQNCTDNGKEGDFEGWNWKWSKLDAKNLPSGDCYNIRLYATYPPAYGPNNLAVDNVMQAKGYTYDEYVWWNTSWTDKRSVTLTVAGDNQPVRFWVNGTDSHIANCSKEIRMTNNVSEMASNVIWDAVSGGNYNCEVLFIGNTGDTYEVYYNNPTATIPNYANVLLYADGFWRQESQWNCSSAPVITGNQLKLSSKSCMIEGTAFTQPQEWQNYFWQFNASAGTGPSSGRAFALYNLQGRNCWQSFVAAAVGTATCQVGYRPYTDFPNTNFYRNLNNGETPLAPPQGDADFTFDLPETFRFSINSSGGNVITSVDHRFYGETAFVVTKAASYPYTDGTVVSNSGTVGFIADASDFYYKAVAVWKGAISEPYWPASEPGITLGAEVPYSTSSVPWSSQSVAPASPQTHPATPVTFSITWTPSGGSMNGAWLNTNITGYNNRWAMSNTTPTDWSITLPAGGAGPYNYSFYANLTDMTWNSTSTTSYVVNKAAGSATLSSTAGWTYLTGIATTLSCAGTTPTLYVGHVQVANPYTNTFAVGTYNVSCNVTDTQNYTAASDSETLTVLPAGLLTSAFDETAPNPELVYNLTIYNSSYTKTWTNLGATFFALSNTSLPKGFVTLEYSSTGYGSRTYYETVGGGLIINNTAYLLQTTLGSYVRFHTLTNTEVGIVGALVTVNRTIFGVTTVVGAMLSDSTGTATFFLNPLVSYTVYPTKSGYSAPPSSITPGGTSDFKLYMTTSGALNVSTQFSNLVWNFTPACGGITNSSTTFFYYISDSNNTLNSYGFNVTLPNGTTYSVNGSNPAGSTLNMTLDLRNFSGQSINITRWFNETGYSLYVFRYGCIVWNTATGNSLFSQLAALKGAFCPMPAAGEIPWCLPLNIIALMVTMGVGAVGAARFGANGGGMAAAGTLWIFTFLTWWPWQPALLLTLGMIGVMVMSRRLG